ncbi:MFS transporter [Clostridium cibarium]|uniref:MFS transporter n=1 Tax=Clostridium cibarium TaxID=2762247 RepID=A0ABR8PR07_9CLOT|nr:MFS transporter [Clostridium cibarium]MBD7910603.1 MFS transporter [Clostridium cibarium]
MKNKYTSTAIAMYINYFVHGMGAIILAQNMTYLTEQLHTDKAGVSYIISALGIGRLIVLYISGVLSDKFGRKPFIYLGMITYIIFFAGILLSPNVTVAFIFALLAGVANSFLDAGTYPALMECYPKATGTASVMIKAFISAGQFTLPIVIGFLVSNGLYFGYSFIFCIIIFVLNGIFLIKRVFPVANEVKATESVEEIKSEDEMKHKPNFWIEGISLIIIGFTATATFLVVQVWLPQYGKEVAGMIDTASLKLISYYSLGSISAVVVTSVLVKNLIKPVRFVVIYPLISLVTLMVLWMFPTPTTCMIGAFSIGFSAAGGVLQLALAAMSDLFPTSKGKITGMVYTASSIASFAVPAITGIISKTSMSNIILFDAGVTALGIVLGIIVNIRYNIMMKSN